MEPNPRPSIQNRILAALSPDQYARILPNLEPFEFSHGRIIYEMGAPIDYMYFPEAAVVSLVTQMMDGKIVEVGLVGREGMTGLAALLGQNTSAERAIVQIPDGGTRAKTSVIKQEFQRGNGFQNVLLHYANSLMRQVSQTAACNASHSVEERLSRWLLMCQDRVQSTELHLTQEFIAEMLGTRRATVNVAAVTLQSAKLIQYNRGHITITDRPGLEGFSCECYETLKNAISSGDGNHDHV